MNPETLEAIRTIVDYCWPAEVRDFAEQVRRGEDTSSHVYRRLVLVSRAMGESWPNVAWERGQLQCPHCQGVELEYLEATDLHKTMSWDGETLRIGEASVNWESDTGRVFCSDCSLYSEIPEGWDVDFD